MEETESPITREKTPKGKKFTNLDKLNLKTVRFFKYRFNGLKNIEFASEVFMSEPINNWLIKY